MTKEQAKEIKLMDNAGFSDRKIAQEYIRKYKTSTENTRQEYGRELVEEAMKVLGETIDDGWTPSF